MRILLYFVFFFIFSFLFNWVKMPAPFIWSILTFTIPLFLANAIYKAIACRKVAKKADSLGMSQWAYVRGLVPDDEWKELQKCVGDKKKFERQLDKIYQHDNIGYGEIVVIRDYLKI